MGRKSLQGMLINRLSLWSTVVQPPGDVWCEPGPGVVLPKE